MCGRTACTLAPSRLQKRFRAAQVEQEDKYRQSYNVGPGRYQPVLIESTNEEGQKIRKIVLMKWGLVPRWNRKGSGVPHPINARSDKLTTSNMYIPLAKKRRCVVLADGYFEWKKLKGGKQPYFFKPKPVLKAEPEAEAQIKEEPPADAPAPPDTKNVEADSDDFGVMAFAGIYDVYEDKETKEIVHSYAIITVDASKQASDIHDRIPAILEGDEVDLWLNTDLPIDEIKGMLKPKEELLCYPVSNTVGNVAHDVPECVAPVEISKLKAPAAGEITNFFKPRRLEVKPEEVAVKAEVKTEDRSQVIEIPDTWDEASTEEPSTEVWMESVSSSPTRSPTRSPRKHAKPMASQVEAEVIDLAEDDSELQQALLASLNESKKRKIREDAVEVGDDILSESPAKRSKLSD